MRTADQWVLSPSCRPEAAMIRSALAVGKGINARECMEGCEVTAIDVLDVQNGANCRVEIILGFRSCPDDLATREH